MTSRQQKTFEHLILRGFLRQLAIPAEPVEGDFEAPDAVIEMAHRRIGIEITEIQKSAEERAFRAPKDELVQRTRQRYDAAAGMSICVTFSFHLHVGMRAVRRDILSDQIADILHAHAQPGMEGVIILSGQQLPTALRPWLRELRFWNTNGTCIWQISEASWVAPLTSQILQERVEAKAGRLANYRLKGYAEYWLLICADPLNPACRFDPARDFNPATVSSPFDRTFFYDAWHLIELGTRI